MNRKDSIAIVAFVSSIVLAGCVQYRATCTVSAPGADSSIRTRSKYRIESYEVEYEEGAYYSPTIWAEKLYGETEQARIKEAAVKFQPEVFLEDGIPVKIRCTCNSSEGSDGEVLDFLTLGVWPGGRNINSTWTYRIEIDDGKHAASDMTVTADMRSICSFLPVSWLMPIDGRQYSGEGRVFDANENFVRVGNLDFRDSDKLESLRYEAISYGLASCLKRFEDNMSESGGR